MITGGRTPASLRPVERRELRYVLCLMLLDRGRTMTVPDLLEGLDRQGLSVVGRASKAVSDALRWERRRGRVVRLDRGRYRTGAIPRSTIWWLRQQVREMEAHAVARNLDPGPWSGS